MTWHVINFTVALGQINKSLQLSPHFTPVLLLTIIQPSPMLVHRDYLEVFLQLAAINLGEGGKSDAAGSSEPVFPQCFSIQAPLRVSSPIFPSFSHWVSNQTAPFLVAHLTSILLKPHVSPGFLQRENLR